MYPNNFVLFENNISVTEQILSDSSPPGTALFELELLLLNELDNFKKSIMLYLCMFCFSFKANNKIQPYHNYIIYKYKIFKQ